MTLLAESVWLAALAELPDGSELRPILLDLVELVEGPGLSTPLHAVMPINASEKKMFFMTFTPMQGLCAYKGVIGVTWRNL